MVLNRADFAVWVVKTGEELLESSGQRPRKLLPILQCTGHPSPQPLSMILPQMSTVPWWRNPGIEGDSSRATEKL